jgi:hypothetical protein
VAREEAAEEINDGSCVGEEHIKPRHPKSCCSIQLYSHVKTRITAVPGISPRTVMRVIFLYIKRIEQYKGIKYFQL